MVPNALAADPPERRFENDQLAIRVIPRTPQQMAGFYEARGFPPAMIELIRRQCFIAAIIHNKSRDVVWLELDRWRFSGPGGVITRRPRDAWQPLWEAIDAPLPSRSTFRWTLLPETLDFRPDEREGGHVVLPAIREPFRLEMNFATGEDKSGKPIQVRFDDLRCGQEVPQ